MLSKNIYIFQKEIFSNETSSDSTPSDWAVNGFLLFQ